MFTVVADPGAGQSGTTPPSNHCGAQWCIVPLS